MTSSSKFVPDSRPPLVSILITVYKRTAYLSEALQSVHAQTFRDYEILVKDDSGSHAAREIAENAAGSMPLRYLPNEKTLGIASSLRAGLEAARGKYIAILNDDDAWEPDFLERLVPPLEKDSRRVLAFSDHWIMKADSSVDVPETQANSLLYGRTNLSEGELPDPPSFVLIKNGVPVAMASLFRKDALDPALLVNEVSGAYDFWIACLLAATSQPFYYVAKCLTRYRVHEEMETARRSPDKHACMVYIFDAMLRRNMFPDRRSFVRSRLGGSIFRVGRDQLYFNRLRESRALFRQAFAVFAGWRPPVAYALSFLPLNLRIRLHLSAKIDF